MKKAERFNGWDHVGGILIIVPLSLLFAGLIGCERNQGAGDSGAHDSTARSLDHAGLGVTTLQADLRAAPASIGEPLRLALTDEALWVSDSAYDPSLHVLDPQTLTLLYSLGRRGEGPGEFSTRPWGFTSGPGETRGAIWAFDYQLQRMTRFEPRSSSEYELKIVTLAGSPVVHQIVWVEPERIIGVSRSAEARFSVFSPDGERQATFGDVSLLPGTTDVPVASRLRIASTQICARPPYGFALVNSVFGQIEYYDNDGNRTGTAAVPFPSEPLFEQRGGETTVVSDRIYYLDCAATRQHLYAVFSGRLSAAFEAPARFSAEFIHVFDHQGNLEEILHLDNDIRGIAVSASDEVLFASSLAESAVYRYDLVSRDKG